MHLPECPQLFYHLPIFYRMETTPLQKVALSDNLESPREAFPLWLSSNEPDQDPRGRRLGQRVKISGLDLWVKDPVLPWCGAGRQLQLRFHP